MCLQGQPAATHGSLTPTQMKTQHTRRALTTTILNHFLQIIHIIVDHDMMYNLANQDVDKTSL